MVKNMSVANIFSDMNMVGKIQRFKAAKYDH